MSRIWLRSYFGTIRCHAQLCVSEVLECSLVVLKFVIGVPLFIKLWVTLWVVEIMAGSGEPNHTFGVIKYLIQCCYCILFEHLKCWWSNIAISMKLNQTWQSYSKLSECFRFELLFERLGLLCSLYNAHSEQIKYKLGPYFMCEYSLIYKGFILKALSKSMLGVFGTLFAVGLKIFCSLLDKLWLRFWLFDLIKRLFDFKARNYV